VTRSRRRAKTAVIDFSPESAERYRSGYAIVAIDVIRATTTLATGRAAGRRCYVAPSVELARVRASGLRSALLAGESGGEIPDGFDLTNSPAALAERSDCERPMILVSSSGTRLLHNARWCDAAYVACFRNHEAVARHAAVRHERVAVIGAGTRGEFREEDQICCAWIAARLFDLGFGAGNAFTAGLAARFRHAPAEACLVSASVAYLRRTNQLEDLDFVLSHVNDLQTVFALRSDEVVPVES
jgi:2-phosphosulfolactate phosphatase